MNTKKLIGHFLRGLLLLAPIAITVYVVYKIIQGIDQLVPNEYPGLGLAIFVVGITLIGYISTTLVFKPIFNSFEKLITQTPLVKIIYSSIKDLFSAVVSEKKKFNKPVLVLLKKEFSMYKLGFITQNDLKEFGLQNMVAVYLPHSYAWSGNLFIVPKENVTPLNISSTDALKFIISGGVTELGKTIPDEPTL